MSDASKNSKIFFSLFKDLSSIDPPKFYFMYLCFVLNGLLFSFIVWAKERVFDSAIAFSSREAGLYEIAIWLSLMFGLYLVNSVFDALGNYYAEVYDLKAVRYMHGKINEKSRTIPAIRYEDPEFLDQIEKCYSGANAAMSYLNSVMDLVFMYSPFVIFMGAYLWGKEPKLVLIIFLIFLPSIYAQKVKKKKYKELEDDVAPLRRRYDGLTRSVLSLSGWREAKVCSAFGFLRSELKDTVLSIQNLNNKVERRSALYDLSASAINLLGYFAVMYLLFGEMMTGGISVGAFGAVIFSVDELYSLMEEAIVGRFGSSSSKIPKIQNYFDFLQSEEEARGDWISDGSISLQEVCFKYPKSDEYVLEDISLSISDGERIAIVGENGAGKTTLAKLLLGIFEPCAGSVAVGSCPSTQVDYLGISAVFQDFNRYRLSIGDNVRISDYVKNAGDPEILELLEEFDLGFESHDLDTLLSKEFGGIDISYGQWQRLAIARGIYRDNKILVLDEPTSAIDPLEESYIFDKFKEVSKGRTTIIITHRLSLVRFVDRIIVLKDGRVVGFDSHENLLEESEYYKTMWDLQSERYLL